MSNAKTLSGLWRYPEAAAFLGITRTACGASDEARGPFMRPFKKKGSRILFDLSGSLRS